MVNKYWCLVRMIFHYCDFGITRLALFLSVIKTGRIKELQVQMIKWGYFDHALTFHSSQTCVCGILITPSFGMYIFEGLVNQEGEIADGRAATYFVKLDLAFPPRGVFSKFTIWRAGDLGFLATISLIFARQSIR